MITQKRVFITLLILGLLAVAFLVLRQAGERSLGGDPISCRHGVCSDGSTY